jgi:Domain of unknown function (DUF4326)
MSAERTVMAKRLYSIEAPDQQRLKVARVEIEAVIRKHDLAGVVVLHTPGRDLACWCPLNEPCHANVLLRIANGGVGDG